MKDTPQGRRWFCTHHVDAAKKRSKIRQQHRAQLIKELNQDISEGMDRNAAGKKWIPTLGWHTVCRRFAAHETALDNAFLEVES